MVHVKKLVMSGFKSFARKTEIIFDQGVNVVLGPNGSGKSNIADALCFVLGRLSIKSMRAAKSANLLFMGSKYIKPAKEACVELVFDNSDRTFALEHDEVTISRTVRRNGQGIYRINGETKTRLEIIEMLAQAGIDPHGFNLILQGQIQAVVRMHPEERRKVIEEVAGISIYESRKEKSLHELEKTEERLREISAILRERTAYLRNLEREKAEAQRFKDLELLTKRCKATLLHRKEQDKTKEVDSIVSSIDEKLKQKDKLREKVERIQDELNAHTENIQQMNKSIQQASGLEQESLHSAIANLKAEIEGLLVRKEHHEHRGEEIARRVAEMEKSLPELESEIEGLRQESPIVAKKAEELQRKKSELALVEEEKKKAQSAKSELQSLRELLRDKERQLARANAEGEYIVKQLESLGQQLAYQNEAACTKALVELRQKMQEHEQQRSSLQNKALEHEKNVSLAMANIERWHGVSEKVGKLDTCPLCQSKITPEHVQQVISEANSSIGQAKKLLESNNSEIKAIREQEQSLAKNKQLYQQNIFQAEGELHKHRSLQEKHEQLKRSVAQEQALKKEMQKLEDKRKALETKTFDLSKLEEQYHNKILEIEEISSRTTEDSNTALLYKERELESILNVLKQGRRDSGELERELAAFNEKIGLKTSALEKKEEQDRQLSARFKKLFEQRDATQKQVQDKNLAHSELQQDMRQLDDQINYLKIGKAKIDAEREALEIEIQEYAGLELLSGSVLQVEERLKKTQESLQQIGSINLRALEVYEGVKREYDSVQDKVNVLEKEKQDIMSIVTEIDHKKIRSFLKTFKAMNALFNSNFSKLSNKGAAFLELENPEDIFAGGVSIVVKMTKGKYFDVTSLSGGEQTLVALSLLFAIQEYKPYSFYIFDEIDAALDKRNSERLAALLNQYMKSGQYIVITHNDALIMNAEVLYGVSMHDGVSKILSLKLDSALPASPNLQENDEISLLQNQAEKTISQEVGEASLSEELTEMKANPE